MTTTNDHGYLVYVALDHIKEILETMPTETLQDLQRAYSRVSNESEQNRYDSILRENLTVSCDHINQWDSHKNGTEWIESELQAAVTQGG